MGRKLFALALVLSTVACTSTRIEYDRMTGTAFPAPQTRNGATVTIPWIYGNEGYAVIVAEDDEHRRPHRSPEPGRSDPVRLYHRERA